MSYLLTPFFSAFTGTADPGLLKFFVKYISQPYLFYLHCKPQWRKKWFKKCNKSRFMWPMLQWGRWVLGLLPYPSCHYCCSACCPCVAMGQWSTGRALCASNITAILSFSSRAAVLASHGLAPHGFIRIMLLQGSFVEALSCIRGGMQKEPTKWVWCGQWIQTHFLFYLPAVISCLLPAKTPCRRSKVSALGINISCVSGGSPLSFWAV